MQLELPATVTDSTKLGSIYYIINGMTLNKEAYDKVYIRAHKDIFDKSRGDSAGVELKYTMTGDTRWAITSSSMLSRTKRDQIRDANYNWGRKPESLPPGGSGGLDVTQYGRFGFLDRDKTLLLTMTTLIRITGRYPKVSGLNHGLTRI